MATLEQPRFERGSKILITGVNGLVASHVADQALKAGYNVVGSVRDSKKAHWMQSRFDKEYGSGRFELVTVSDLAADGAFDEAVRGTVRHSIPSAICADSLGVSGIAHVASIIGSVDPNEMIPTNVASAVNMLKAAAKEPSV
jgi:nucleoside-diphosphate-sugar epimerase